MSSQQDLSGTHLQIEGSPVYPLQPCKRCGNPGHFSFVCRVKKGKNGKPVESDSEPEYTSDKGY